MLLKINYHNPKGKHYHHLITEIYTTIKFPMTEELGNLLFERIRLSLKQDSTLKDLGISVINAYVETDRIPFNEISVSFSNQDQFPGRQEGEVGNRECPALRRVVALGGVLLPGRTACCRSGHALYPFYPPSGESLKGLDGGRRYTLLAADWDVPAEQEIE